MRNKNKKERKKWQKEIIADCLILPRPSGASYSSWSSYSSSSSSSFSASSSFPFRFFSCSNSREAFKNEEEFFKEWGGNEREGEKRKEKKIKSKLKKRKEHTCVNWSPVTYREASAKTHTYRLGVTTITALWYNSRSIVLLSNNNRKLYRFLRTVCICIYNYYVLSKGKINYKAMNDVRMRVYVCKRWTKCFFFPLCMSSWNLFRLSVLRSTCDKYAWRYEKEKERKEWERKLN